MEYRERLTTPGWYWLVGVTFGTTGFLALGLWFDRWVALGAAAASIVVIGVALALFGRTQIFVDRHGLRVGPHSIEWQWVGHVSELDAERTSALLGAESEPAALVVERPWLQRAVLVEIDDAADPHPYWLISTRHPRQLATAIASARTTVAS